MESIARLCTRAVWLDKGRVSAVGDTADVVSRYTRSSSSNTSHVAIERDPTRQAQVISLGLVDESGQPLSVLSTWAESFVRAVVVVGAPTPGLGLGVQVHTSSGLNLLDEYTLEHEGTDLSAPGTYDLRMSLPPVLPPGEYTLGAWLGTNYEEFEQHEHAVAFSVEGSDGGVPDRLVRLGLAWTAVHRGPDGSGTAGFSGEEPGPGPRTRQ